MTTDALSIAAPAAQTSPSVAYSQNLQAQSQTQKEAGDLFEAALRAARLLTNHGNAPGGNENTNVSFLTGGAGQNSISAQSANRVSADLMNFSDDSELVTALEMFVNLAGEGGILDLTSTDFDAEHKEELRQYFLKIGLSPDDADKLLRLINRLKTAGAEAIELLDFTDEETKDGVGLTEEEKRKNVDMLAQIADMLYPQMDAPDFEAALDFIKVTPDTMIVTNQNIALVLIPQFDKELGGETQYMRQSDIINALYTLEGMTEEQLAAIKNQLDAGDFTLGEAIAAISDVERIADTSGITDENGEPPKMSFGKPLTEKQEAAFALTEMVRAFRRENNAKPEDDGIIFEGRLYNIRTGTFEDRVIKAPEFTDTNDSDNDDTDNFNENDTSDDQLPPFADSLKTADTEAQPQIQTQAPDTPETDNRAVNAVNANNIIQPQTGTITPPVRTETVSAPVYDPPEVQLAGRIMSMDLSLPEVQEMTVVLRPEALGEVAVKVTSENGTITVALTAAKPETQKILGDTAASLLQSLKNGGADVKEVLIIAASDAGEQMGLNLTSGGFTRQSGEGSAAQNEAAGYVNSAGGEDDTDTAETAPEENYESRGARLWQTA
ncbi:MAG: flagellar hook-length control protein FliK [Ruminococcus sp.]|nr:flagellar hook-length control protein FliK [Ruminococcus sp.]